MKTLLRTVAKAFVALTHDLEPADLPEACDAVLQFLAQRGAGVRERRMFLALVKRIAEKEGALAVLVVTPSGQTGPFAAILTRSLEQILERPVLLREQEDDELIGGVRLRFGDERYDGSLRSALAQAQTHLSAAVDSSFFALSISPSSPL